MHQFGIVCVLCVHRVLNMCVMSVSGCGYCDVCEHACVCLQVVVWCVGSMCVIDNCDGVMVWHVCVLVCACCVCDVSMLVVLLCVDNSYVRTNVFGCMMFHK